MALVNFGVQRVMGQFLLPDPAPLHHRLADGGGDACKSIFNDPHASDAHFRFIQHAGAREDAVERPQGRRGRGGFQFFRLAANAPEEALKSRVMEKLFIKFAVFFDQVMENVQARFWVRDPSH